MRPNQQNNKNRSRGRNGGRKHVNPLSRNYESNGPDVKVRGNASHIAEKYQQLARDAVSSGDSVMAENYLQHAEHYFRIVMAAQPQQRPDYNQDNDSDESEDGNETANANSNVGHQQQPERPRVQTEEQAEAAPQPQPRAPRQRRSAEAKKAEASENPPEAVAEAKPADAAEQPQSASSSDEGEESPRKRRPRRRRASSEPTGESGETSKAADTGELPAFITSGSPAAAE
ncbi:hypothetical protein GCM10007989_36990 [Devosia pacifica]|uniref:DUF4167 domain-containing protein n=1 Tax=Devosia pacifica TaxID=1335967 RepID=A0A918SGT6_9HYPH|nr:DUF4167 domain-containing protein [Devosia pacifica]GHA37742.1 hypothetical protein GCM10007989_36990 [Devosia pacifica]